MQGSKGLGFFFAFTLSERHSIKVILCVWLFILNVRVENIATTMEVSEVSRIPELLFQLVMDFSKCML